MNRYLSFNRAHGRALVRAGQASYRQPQRCAPGGCEEVIVDSEVGPEFGYRRECGQPATWKHNRAGGLIYCNTHRPDSRIDTRPLREHELAAFRKPTNPKKP